MFGRQWQLILAMDAIHRLPPRKNGVSQETELEMTSITQGLPQGSDTYLTVQEWLCALPSDSFETQEDSKR